MNTDQHGFFNAKPQSRGEKMKMFFEVHRASKPEGTYVIDWYAPLPFNDGQSRAWIRIGRGTSEAQAIEMASKIRTPQLPTRNN